MFSPIVHLPSSAANKYLSSWKEIAQYFNRGVRTVQRWEAELGMPVRRPHGGSRTAVMAIREELDSWMASRPFRKTSTTTESQASPAPQGSAPVNVLVVGDAISNNYGGHQDASFLKKLGPLLKLEVVRNTESALLLLRAIDEGKQPEPDLIILDQKLFGIIAHQLFRSSQANSRLKYLQILVRPSVFTQKGTLAA